MLSAVFGKNKALSDSLPLYLQNWFSNLPKQDPSSWYSLGLPKISWGKIGLLSGADIIDFRLVANEVRKGASLIIDSTNLDLLSNPYLNRQLLAAAIFRAIENNRYILFSTGRGVKAIIEPSGAVQCLDLSSTATKQNNNSLEGNLLGTVQFRLVKNIIYQDLVVIIYLQEVFIVLFKSIKHLSTVLFVMALLALPASLICQLLL